MKKMMDFLKKCWKTRTAYAYAGLMLIACILVYNLYFASGINLMKTEEEKAAIESSRSEGKVTYGESNIIQGDITDRNGIPLMYTEAQGEEARYKDALAYTQAIGFANDYGDYLLAEENKSYLYDALSDTNKGCTIRTTLDSRLQEYCFGKLISQCKGDGAGDEGSIVIMDAKTGRILTWAFYPSFDVSELTQAMKKLRSGETDEEDTDLYWSDVVAEQLGKENGRLISGGAGGLVEFAAGTAAGLAEREETREAVEKTDPANIHWTQVAEEELGSLTYPLLHPRMPGSVFKIVTSIGIIEKGQSCLDETVYDGTGYLDIDGIQLPNAGGAVYGEVGFKEAFVKSINVYFAKKAIEDIGKTALDAIAERCGIGSRFGFDFGDMVSNYAFEDDDRQLARTAIGQQNVQLSAIQVAMITMGAACDGKIAEPHMVQEIYRTKQQNSTQGSTYSKGEVVQTEKINTDFMNIMSPETSAVIQDAMVAMGDSLKEKTGLDLIVNGESCGIGCKTGTGQIDKASGGYSGYNNIWLTSYAPADDPQYIVVVNRYGVDGKGESSYGATLFGDLIDIYNMLFEDNTVNEQDTEEESGDV